MSTSKEYYVSGFSGGVISFWIKNHEQGKSAITLGLDGSNKKEKSVINSLIKKHQEYVSRCNKDEKEKLVKEGTNCNAFYVSFYILTKDVDKWLQKIMKILEGKSLSDGTHYKFVMSQRDFHEISSSYSGTIVVCSEFPINQEPIKIRLMKGSKIMILYGRSIVVGGNVNVEVRGNATVEAIDKANVTAYDTANVFAKGSASVELFNSAEVTVWDSAFASLHDMSSGTLYSDKARAECFDSSKLVIEKGVALATDNARIEHRNSSTSVLKGNAYARVYASSQVQLSGNASADLFDKSTAIVLGEASVTLHDDATAISFERGKVPKNKYSLSK